MNQITNQEIENKRNASMHAHQTSIDQNLIPPSITVDGYNKNQSYNVNIGGKNGLNLLINYQNNNNIVTP